MSTMTAEDLRRRRGSGDVLQDGECVGFDMAFMDAAPHGGAVFLHDSRGPSDREIADAYAGMMDAYANPNGKPAEDEPAPKPLADADPVAAAYSAMVADLTRHGR